MNTLKRYIFWAILFLVLAVGVGFHLLTVPSVQEEKETLRDQCKNENKQVQDFAQSATEIRNAAYVRQAQGYIKHLKDQETELGRLWSERKPVWGRDFENVPGVDQISDFNLVWMTKIRKDVLDEAQQRNLRLPADFASTHLFEGRPTDKSAAQRAERIQHVALTKEVVHILASVKGKATRPKFEPKLGNQEPTESVDLGVVSLDTFQMLGAEERANREGLARQKAWELAGAGVPPPLPPSPYSALALELRFTAPFALVPATVQALESSAAYHAVVQKIDFQRVAAPFPLPESLPAIAPASPVRPAGYVNTHYAEAPVQVLVVLDLITLKPDALRK